MFVILIPLREQLYCRSSFERFKDCDIDKPNKAIGGILKKQKIEYFDLLPGLLEETKSNKQVLYFQTDPHWNKYGQKVVADLVFKFFKERGI